MHSNEKKTLETPAQVLEMKYSLRKIWILSITLISLDRILTDV